MGSRRLGAVLGIRLRFLLLLALCVAATIVAGGSFARYLAKPGTGLVSNYPEVVFSAGRLIFAPRALFSPALSAGLLPNRDEILSIDGAPVRGTLDVVRADASVRGFGAVALEVRRDGGEIRTVLLQPSFTLSRIDWVFILVFISALAAAALILTFRIPDEPGTVPLVLAALTYLVFTAVKPFYYESLLSNSLIHLGKLTSWLLVFFGMYFPKPKGPRWSRILVIATVMAVYAVFIGLRISCFMEWTASGGEQWLDRYRALGRIGNVSDGVAYLAWAALMTVSYLKAGARQERRQIQWILAGILIALPPYFFFDQLPLILGRLAVPRVGLGSLAELFLSVIPVFVIIGLTRHRMFDIRFLLARYTLYGALFVLMFALFSFLYLPLRDAIGRGYGAGSPVSDFLAAGVLLLLMIPLRFLLARVGAALLSVPLTGTPRPSNAGLARRNAELAAALEELRSRAARAHREEMLAELRDVLRGIVARVRGPLREITSSVAGLRDTRAGAHEGTAADGRALEASVRLGDFLRTLESLASSGPSIPALARPQDLVEAAVDRTRKRFPRVEFGTSISAEQRVSCFAGELIEALCRVLENAAEASGPGRGGVQVVAHANASQVLIDIVDSGSGMGPAARAQAFRPFHSTRPGHDGLGLYYARLVSERIGGTVEIESRVGEGTRVRFAFPGVGPSEGKR